MSSITPTFDPSLTYATTDSSSSSSSSGSSSVSGSSTSSSTSTRSPGPTKIVSGCYDCSVETGVSSSTITTSYASLTSLSRNATITATPSINSTAGSWGWACHSNSRGELFSGFQGCTFTSLTTAVATGNGTATTSLPAQATGLGVPQAGVPVDGLFGGVLGLWMLVSMLF